MTTGLIDTLNKHELEGVIAHELSHIKNLDMLTGTVAASVAGAIFMIVLAPIAAILIQLMISRYMEYSADTGAARTTGSPHGLISALKKIHAAVKRPARGPALL